MHDTFLLKRISESLCELCKKNKIARVIKLRVITSNDSHIQKGNLYEHLLKETNGAVGEWTEVIIDRRDMESLSAVIESMEGEALE